MANETDYKTTIKIEGDSAGAQSAIGRASNALKGLLAPLTKVRTAIGLVMRAMGVFYLAAEGVRLVVSAVKGLHDWMSRAANAARELADQLERDSIATAAAHAAEAYKALNKEIEEANRLERERNAILDRRKATARDLEDAQAAVAMEQEIASLDPASETYAADRSAIERKYARQASRTAAARAGDDSRENAARLYDAANARDRQADAMSGELARAEAQTNRAVERSFRLSRDADAGVPGAKEKAAEAEEEWKRLHDAAKAIREAMETLRKEAESLRRQAGESAGGGRAAALRDTATQTRIDNEERRSKAEQEARDRANSEREMEASRREAARTAQQQARVERQNRIAELSEGIRVNEAMQNGIIAAATPSQNRLTAMGLGSGSGVVRVQERMAESLKDLVKLGQQQVAELKQLKDSPQVAVFAD